MSSRQSQYQQSPYSSQSQDYRSSTYSNHNSYLQQPYSDYRQSRYQSSQPAQRGQYGQGARTQIYYEPGEDRDEPFDVRADFDGDGPRWSERFGGGGLRDVEDKSYRPVDDHVAPSGHSISGKTAVAGQEEMVSVPVLGPDWTKNELHELSRRGQAEVTQDKRSRAWRAWNRDQRGMCGVKWLTRRMFAFMLFFFCAGLGVTLYFVIPRNPSFAFYTDRPFDVDNSTIAFSRTPTNYSFAGNLNLFADASSSYLSLQFSDVQATLHDLVTDKVIATGNLGKYKLPNKRDQPIVFPVQFAYDALNATDTTWVSMYQACGHLWTGTIRPDLKFRLVLKLSIIGLVTKPEMSTQISDVACPFELPATSV